MAIPEKLILVAEEFDLTAGRITTCLEGLDEADFYRSPERTNHMLWLLGHVTNTRLGLINLLGGSADRPWNDLFGKGSTPGDRESLPSVGETRDAWARAVPALAAQFEQVDDALLAQPSPRPYPLADKSLLGAAAFLATHEMYHLGQMAALRKWLGQGQLVG